MAESKSKPASKPALLKASESSDPAVHQLMAELQTHNLNGDKKAADEVVAQLAELGYK